MIIAVDDFGTDERTDKRVMKLAECGKVDRVAIFIDRINEINEPIIEKLIEMGIAVDVHLAPLSIQSNKKERKGTFMRSALFLIDFIFGFWKTGRLEKNWERQILLFHNRFGRFPDGLNSHEHVHFFPVYLRIILKLAKKHQIPYLRFGGKSLLFAKSPTSILLWTLRILGKKSFQKSKVLSSDYLASLDWRGDWSYYADFLSAHEGFLELVIHPKRSKEYFDLKKFRRQ